MPGNSCTYTSSSPSGVSSLLGRSRKRSRHNSASVRSSSPAKCTIKPPLKGEAATISSSWPFFARSPDAVPANTRRPGAKTASGSSVIGSTTRSPRMPCALRTRPTMIRSGGTVAMLRPLRALFLLGALGGRNRGRVQLAAESRFVTALEEAGFAEQRPNGVGRLRAVVEPVVHAIVLEIDRLVTLPRRVLANDLDELAVARALRVGDDDTIHGLLLAARTTKADLNGHWNVLIRVI